MVLHRFRGPRRAIRSPSLGSRISGDRGSNAILPSVIDTPANRRDMPDADFGAWAKPEGIAAVLRFLVSDDAREIHGAAIPVSGRV